MPPPVAIRGREAASQAWARLIESPVALRWTVGIAGSMATLLSIALLFMLALATDEQRLFEQHYERLFIINVVVASVLLGIIVWGALRLWLRLRRGKFGSRLLIKLAMVFGLVSFAPGVVIYLVSYQFVDRSIESWFNIKVEGALDAGLTLGRATLDALSEDLGAKARTMASQLADKTDASAALALERLREQAGVDEAILWSEKGQLIASAGGAKYQLQVQSQNPQLARRVRSQRIVTWIEGLEESANAPPAQEGGTKLEPSTPTRIKAQVVVSSDQIANLNEVRILQVSQTLSPTLVSNLLAVQDANREYQERALARSGLRRMYLGTLTLSLFLAVFTALVLAALLGNQITRPLLVLAEGVSEVADGNLQPKRTLAGSDELASLTRSFAGMTQQLADAQTTIQQSLDDVRAARSSLQTLLDNLTSGVIVLAPDGRILTANPGATRVLRTPLAPHSQRTLSDVPGLSGFAGDVQRQFEDLERDRWVHGLDHWQASFTLSASATATAGSVSLSNSDARTLVARGAHLPDGTRLLVLDDISDIVSAQRAQAWGEVARRLAHEIKNPLTPIQLSAERLQAKLEHKVAGAERTLLDKSVKTIVDQVDAMKRLVNDFRDFARLPKSDLKAVDLNALLSDVLYMYGESEGETASEHLPIQCRLDPACPPIWGDVQQLRQVIHNLVQNAQDASRLHASQDPSVEPTVQVSTQHSAESQRVQLIVQDNGAGFTPSVLERAFEPYITTKAKGTGLGLAVVKKIVDDHHARITLGNVVQDGRVLGAKVSLSFNAAHDTSGAVPSFPHSCPHTRT